MEHKVVPGKQILQIAESGLTYIAEAGKEEFIDFPQCYRNYVAQLLEPQNLQRIKEMNQLSDQDLQKTIDRWKQRREIARRNILGDPIGTNPYIEFYTQPPIRVEFETQEIYREIRSTIEDFGWETFDLS